MRVPYVMSYTCTCSAILANDGCYMCGGMCGGRYPSVTGTCFDLASYLHLQYGNTPLLLASQFGHVECVKVLSDRGAQAQLKDKVSTRDLSDW